MKITSFCKSFSSKKIFLVFLALVIAICAPVQIINHSVYADHFDDQIMVLQQQADAYQAEASRLNNEAKTLQSTLAALAAEKSQIQTQLDISQQKYDQLTNQIADTEKQIADNKDALGITIANLYVDDNITPVEMLFGSKNISEYMDKQEYRNSVRDQLTATIAKVKDLKVQLETQKTEVETVLAQQKSQRDSLAAKESQQQNLLDQTKGNEAAYQQLVTASRQKMDDIAAQQRAYYESLVSRGIDVSSGVAGDFSYRNLSPSNGAGGCAGGYQYCQPKDSIVDPWQLYNRECVSYVAWALENKFGKYVEGFNGEGNAWEWAFAHEKPNGSWNPVGSAISYSGAYQVYNPQPGDAVVLPASDSFAPVGHLMVVEYVTDDGWIHISQFNMYGTGQYSTMDIRNSGIVLLRFRNA